MYNNQQHLFLLIVKEHSCYGYRMFCESLYDSKISEYIALKKIPHFTTLQKFARRLPAIIIDKLVFLTRNLFKHPGKILGADSTGMELDHASHHYCKKINRKKTIKGFVNLNMICDTKNKNILVTKIRKRARREFDQEIYGQRAITESVFSSLKRKYGSRLRARKYKTQKVELLFKILSYNIERAMRIAKTLIKWYLAILQSQENRTYLVTLCRVANRTCHM